MDSLKLMCEMINRIRWCQIMREKWTLKTGEWNARDRAAVLSVSALELLEKFIQNSILFFDAVIRFQETNRNVFNALETLAYVNHKSVLRLISDLWSYSLLSVSQTYNPYTRMHCRCCACMCAIDVHANTFADVCVCMEMPLHGRWRIYGLIKSVSATTAHKDAKFYHYHHLEIHKNNNGPITRNVDETEWEVIARSHAHHCYSLHTRIIIIIFHTLFDSKSVGIYLILSVAAAARTHTATQYTKSTATYNITNQS